MRDDHSSASCSFKFTALMDDGARIFLHSALLLQNFMAIGGTCFGDLCGNLWLCSTKSSKLTIRCLDADTSELRTTIDPIVHK